MSVENFERKLPADPRVEIRGDQYSPISGVIAAIFRTDENLRGGRPAISIQFADPGLGNANMDAFLARSSGSIDNQDFINKHLAWLKDNPGRRLRDHLNEMVVAQLKAAGIPVLSPDNVEEVQASPEHASWFITLADAKDLGRALLAMGIPLDDVNTLYDRIDHDTDRPLPQEARLALAYRGLEALLNRLMPVDVNMVFGNHAGQAPYTSLMVKDLNRDLTTSKETPQVAAVSKKMQRISEREGLGVVKLPGLFTGMTYNPSSHVRDANKQQDFILMLAEYFLKDNVGKNGLREEDVTKAMREVRDAMREERSKHP